MNNPVRWIDPTGLFAQPIGSPLPMPEKPYIRWSPRPPGSVPSWQQSSSTPAPTPPAQRIFGFLATIGGGSIPNFYDIGGTGGLVPAITLRDGWEAPSATFTSFSQVVTRIVIHHTATPTTALDRRIGEETVAQRVRSIDNHHRTYNNWAQGVGYHFLVGYDGSIFQGTPLGYQGRHALRGRPYNRNPFSIGVALVGTFSNDTSPSEAQLMSLLWVISYIEANVSTIDSIEPHWAGDGYLGPWSDRFWR